MKKKIIKKMQLCLRVLIITVNTSMALASNLSLVPVEAKEYFEYDPVNAPSWISEIHDISQVCYFSLEGLKVLPVNLFITYVNRKYSNLLKLGVTAIPEDKETVFTYYLFEDDTTGESPVPLHNDFLSKYADRVYRSSDVGHQAKHHSIHLPRHSHSHRVFNHQDELIALFDANYELLQENIFGLCREPLKSHSQTELESYLEGLVFRQQGAERAGYSYFSHKIKQNLTTDVLLKEYLNIPRLVDEYQIESIYQNIVRAAIIFAAYPEMACLWIDDYIIHNGGSSDLKATETIKPCVIYENAVQMQQTGNE